MADALKTFFDRPMVERLAAQLAGASPGFPRARFVREASAGLEGLELLARARHIAAAMARALPPEFPRAVDVLLASLGSELGHVDGNGMAPFHYLPHTIFVAERGREHFEDAMRAQHALTRRFTCEFSIRTFLELHPEATLRRLREWASDPSPHVRRLVSEGTRPRLPWAARLRAFQRDPGPVLELLELLRDDSEEFVRRSVANNLNDIGKDHPDVLVAVARRWSKGASPERTKLLRHALRSLVKKGHPGALAVLGFRGGAALAVSGKVTPRRIRLGDRFDVEVRVENPGPRGQRAVVDLAVHFLKARGHAAAKVFKLRPVELAPGAEATLRKTISLGEMTTRRHYPGLHRVEALVNGRAVEVGAVDVRAVP